MKSHGHVVILWSPDRFRANLMCMIAFGGSQFHMETPFPRQSSDGMDAHSGCLPVLGLLVSLS